MSGRKCIVCERAIRKTTRWHYFSHDDESAPRTKADCQRLVNGRVTSISRWDDGRVARFSEWDGESYDSEYFCTDRCARRQGYASAMHGDRFTWRKS